jgi:hypothetical protein
MGVPPIATKILLFASMSREFICQCPLVTPAALTGNGCADASAGTSTETIQTARSSFFTTTLRAISSSKSLALGSRLRASGALAKRKLLPKLKPEA